MQTNPDSIGSSIRYPELSTDLSTVAPNFNATSSTKGHEPNRDEPNVLPNPFPMGVLPGGIYLSSQTASSSVGQVANTQDQETLETAIKVAEIVEELKLDLHRQRPIKELRELYYGDDDINEYIKSGILQNPNYFYFENSDFLLSSAHNHFCQIQDQQAGNPDYVVAVTPAIDTQAPNYAQGNVTSTNIGYFLDKKTWLKDEKIIVLEELIQLPDYERVMEKILEWRRKGKKCEFLDDLRFNKNNIQQTFQEEINRIAEAKKDVFDEVKPYFFDLESSNLKILFPFNMNQSHWVTGEIRIHKTLNQDNGNKTYFIDIFTHDPYGKGQMDENCYDKLKEVLKKRIRDADQTACFIFNRPISPYPRRQAETDEISCGVIAAEGILQCITGSIIGSYPPGALDLRCSQLKTVQNNAANSEFFITRNAPKIEFLTRHQTELHNLRQLFKELDAKTITKTQNKSFSSLIKNPNKAPLQHPFSFEQILGKEQHRIDEIRQLKGDFNEVLQELQKEIGDTKEIRDELKRIKSLEQQVENAQKLCQELYEKQEDLRLQLNDSSRLLVNFLVDCIDSFEYLEYGFGQYEEHESFPSDDLKNGKKEFDELRQTAKKIDATPIECLNSTTLEQFVDDCRPSFEKVINLPSEDYREKQSIIAYLKDRKKDLDLSLKAWDTKQEANTSENKPICARDAVREFLNDLNTFIELRADESSIKVLREYRYYFCNQLSMPVDSVDDALIEKHEAKILSDSLANVQNIIGELHLLSVFARNPALLEEFREFLNEVTSLINPLIPLKNTSETPLKYNESQKSIYNNLKAKSSKFIKIKKVLDINIKDLVKYLLKHINKFIKDRESPASIANALEDQNDPFDTSFPVDKAQIAEEQKKKFKKLLLKMKRIANELDTLPEFADNPSLQQEFLDFVNEVEELIIPLIPLEYCEEQRPIYDELKTKFTKFIDLMNSLSPPPSPPSEEELIFRSIQDFCFWFEEWLDHTEEGNNLTIQLANREIYNAIEYNGIDASILINNLNEQRNKIKTIN